MRKRNNDKPDLKNVVQFRRRDTGKYHAVDPFLQEILSIPRPDYLPSADDMLKARKKEIRRIIEEGRDH